MTGKNILRMNKKFEIMSFTRVLNVYLFKYAKSQHIGFIMQNYEINRIADNCLQKSQIKNRKQ